MPTDNNVYEAVDRVHDYLYEIYETNLSHNSTDVRRGWEQGVSAFRRNLLDVLNSNQNQAASAQGNNT